MPGWLFWFFPFFILVAIFIAAGIVEGVHALSAWAAKRPGSRR
jgi:hypothetical protein